jgi:single-strand DNA-binding protein
VEDVVSEFLDHTGQYRGDDEEAGAIVRPGYPHLRRAAGSVHSDGRIVAARPSAEQAAVMTPTSDSPDRPQVVLLGRLGSRVEQRILPSGDELTTFTVVVDRPPARGQASRQRIDSIACHTTRAAVVRRLQALAPGDEVRAEGSLRRRFWRAGAGLASATEVEVSAIVRPRAGVRR